MRRTRLVPALLASLSLGLSLGLSACGSSSGSGSSDSGAGLDSVKFTGKVGEDPQVKFTDQLTSTKQESETLVKGDGPVVKQGDQVVVQVWIGNGYTQKVASDSYADHAPQILPVDDKISPIYLDAVKGQTVGSRVVVATPADKLFGDTGNPSLKIGNKDVVVVMFDLLQKLLDKPQGAQRKAPGWAPSLVEKKGAPAGFDFKGTPAPDGTTLRSAVLQQGTGATVKKGQTIFARYLGEVYDGKKPFDQNYTGGDGSPANFRIGVGQVVKGWDKVLVGQKVGSRVIMAIPPKLGYGTKGNSQAGIKGTDTLYFVVDVLGAA